MNFEDLANAKITRPKLGDVLSFDGKGWANGLRVVLTANLPAAGALQNGAVLIEDAGAGDRNLIVYAQGQRFRIDGGAAF
jgi:hypothetical protein